MIRKLTLDSLFLILLLAAYSKGGGAATVVCPGIRRGDGTCCYPTICPRDQQYRLCKDRTAVSRDTCEKCSEGMINPKSVDTRNSTYSDYEYDMCFTPQCDCALGAILANEYDCLKNGKERKCICDLQNGYWGDPNICQSVDESMLKQIQKPGVELTQSGQILPCKNGTFKEKGDNSVCRPHTKCKNGEELKTPGTTTSDSVCYQSPVNDITLPVPESTAESSVPVYPPTNETEGYPGEVDSSNHINIYVSISFIVIVIITAVILTVWRLSNKRTLYISRRLRGICHYLGFPLSDNVESGTSQSTGRSSDTCTGTYYTARSEFSFHADTQEHPPNGRVHENAPLLTNVSVDEHDATGETSAKTVSENVRKEIENVTERKSRLHIRLQHEEREFSEQYKLKCEHHDKELKEPLLIQENGKVVEEGESYKCEQVKDRGGSAGVSSHCHLSNVSEDRARQSTSILQRNSSLELRINSLLRSSGSLDDSSYCVDHSIGSLDHESGSLNHCRDSNVHTQDMASQTADTNQPYRERERQQGNITIIMPNKANIIIGNNNNMILQSVNGCSNGDDDDGCNENEENNYNEEDNQRNSTYRSQVHSDDKSVECESLSSDSTCDQRVDGSNVATTTTARADCVRVESLMTLETSNRTEDQEESEIGHTTSVKKVDSTRSISCNIS